MPKRDPEHMQAQKERILRAAIQCIAATGPERMSVPDICRRAGLSTGALYVHFRNKGEIVESAMRYGNAMELLLPQTWHGIVESLTAMEGHLGFDIATIARFRLHMHAAAAAPGELHDALAQMLNESIEILADKLEVLSRRKDITLRMAPMEAATAIAAFLDGMLWLALSTDRPLNQVNANLKQGLACFVEPPEVQSARPVT
ncbi:TetR/AcrR family transcriptional regulator [Stakelama sp. CBK3Z-3]|uniref:TetR/AcrR family transcriptional regulator n=1 Tax=Stakelama flava TaxID=2860338 RepID=A0ABS6XLH1_9SPHN|nr:TetR/AcrR family transcriptional regulator [Stakelama flava]MBW4330769.1 TetR/AcrR family transcriptional regulator [Stakelama flava]